MKKIVFDLNKYISDCLNNNISHATLAASMLWANDVNGVTKEELEEMGFVIDLSWCIEVQYDA